MAVVLAGMVTYNEKTPSPTHHALTMRPRTEVVRSAGVGESSARTRPDQNVFVAGARGVHVDVGDVAVQPLADRPQRVVVEAVHARVLEAPLGRPAVQRSQIVVTPCLMEYPHERLLKKSMHQEATGRDAAQNDE